MNRTRTAVLITGILFLLASVMVLPSFHSQAFSDRILQMGDRGRDVYELQGRLQLLGFYKSPIDAVFGKDTYWAVRIFQDRFGLKVDGIVGAKTKTKLWEATKRWRPGMAGQPTYQEALRQSARRRGTQQHSRSVSAANHRFSENDINLMANAVYGEARGEPYIGQVAVAAVILNRLESPLFPNTVAGVIFQPGAFTAVADGQIWLQPDETARKAVIDALNGWDPTGGAIYYFNPNTATSGWIWSRPQIKRIGDHIFTM